MIYGLLAALSWGTSAVAAAVAVRRATTYLVVLVSQGLGLTALVLLAVVLRQTLAVITLPVALGLAGAGVIGLVGYLTFYRSVALGPTGLMSAISSTYGGVASGLAVGVLGERIGALGITGIVLAVAGVALASARGNSADTADGAEAGGSPAFSAAAVPLALSSALSYGVGGFVLGYLTRDTGWLLSGIVAHSASVAVLLAAMPVAGGLSRFRAHAGRTVLAWAAAAGLTDAAGVLAFSRGSELGMVAITAAASSTYPIIPLVVGVVLLGERLGWRQLTGIGLIITGLIMLGLA